jgi:uncharacterized spore protein YtfJ
MTENGIPGEDQAPTRRQRPTRTNHSHKVSPDKGKEEPHMTKFAEIVEDATDKIGAKRVFGEPYEKNGVTIIPAARVMGGAGAGEGPLQQGTGGEAPGEEGKQRPTGSGVGYGMSGRPAGAFIVKGDEVTWMPALDVNRIVFGAQVVAIVFLLVMRSIVKTRAKAVEATLKAVDKK